MNKTDIPQDDFNPLQAAKFLADFKNAIGVRTTVAQEYREFEEFDVDRFLSEAKTSSQLWKNPKE